MRGLKNKVAIITGAGKGLGKAIALRLAEEGCDILINDVNESSAQQCAEEIQKLGRKAAISIADVGDVVGAQKIIQDGLKAFGDLNILINNAGILRDRLLIKLTEEDFDSVIRINLKGVFNCGQAFVKSVLEKGHGANIVNISSLAYLGNLGQTNYAAAKAGVVAMTRTWAQELARKGFRANAIAPGLMDTEMIQAIPDKIREQLIGKIPLSRPGAPQEAAALVAFLASDESSYITGQVIHLDGGAGLGL